MKEYKLSGWLVLQDIVSYTTFSEKLRKKGNAGVDKLTRILNAFFTEEELRIKEEGGFLFKLAGDAYFAALPYNTHPDFFKELLKSNVLNQYGLRSRVVGVRGDFSLRGFDMGFGMDVLPDGDIVDLVMRLEENTQAGCISIEDTYKKSHSFIVPEILLKKRRYKNEPISYRPRIAVFLRLDTREYSLINDVLEFIQKRLSYVYVSKIVPYYKGVMLVIFYGVRITTGKEKEMALESSLEIMHFLKDRINFGIGASFDYVYTGVVGGQSFRELTFIGDGINVAARLASLARNEILITEDVVKGVYGMFSLTRLAPVSVKGKKEPVKILKLNGKSIIQSNSIFVDREREQNELVKNIKNKNNTLIVAEAGVGKSTLAKRALSLSQVNYIMTKGIPDSPPLSGVLRIIENIPFEVKSKYPILMDIQNGKEVDREAIDLYLPYILKSALLDSQKSAIFLDDIHWLDKHSLEVMQRLFKDKKLVIVGTIRSEYLSSFKNIGFHKKLPLSPFDKFFTKEYVSAIIGGEVSDELLDMIYERSFGIPFLIEQIVLYMKESNALLNKNGEYSLRIDVKYAIPKDAFSLLMSRYDLLNIKEKNFLAYASLLGGEFDVDVIKAVLPSRYRNVKVDRLLSMEFLIEVKDSVLDFRHSLMREAIYFGILGTRRKFMHRRLARILREKGYDPYKVAIQYERGEARRKAEIYWIESFHNLLSRGFHREASEIINHIESDKVKKLLKAYLLHHFGNYDEAERILKDLKSRVRGKRRAEVLLLLASVYDFSNRYPLMKKTLEEAEKYKKYMDRNLRFSYEENLGIYYDMMGEKEKALRIYKESLRLASTPHEIATTYYNIGWIYFSTYRYKEAERYFKKSIEINPDDRVSVAWSYVRLGQIELFMGNLHKAKMLLKDAASKFHDSRFKFGLELCLYSLISVYILMNDRGGFKDFYYNILKHYDFRGYGLFNLHIGLEYFDMKKEAKDLYEKFLEEEKIEYRLIQLSVSGKLKEAYDLCKEYNFKYRWCYNIRPFFEKNAFRQFVLSYYFLKALYGTLNEDEKKIYDKYKLRFIDIPINAILLKMIENKKKGT